MESEGCKSRVCSAPITPISDVDVAKMKTFCENHPPYGSQLIGGNILGIISRLERAEADKKALEAERDALKAVVAKLPLTADGVPIVPGMTVYPPCGHNAPVVPSNYQPVVVDKVDCWEGQCKWEDWGENDYYDTGPRKYSPDQCYSTREAAIAAKSGTSE